ncbi:MAG: hypothetical protein JRI97_07515 [Deltaproteobacteria bacterium]|nr:hypothetical protein [Deltaproteobacteria bacterium]
MNDEKREAPRIAEKEDEQARKKAVFEGMSERRKKQVLARGYDKWDPFLAPKDPIDIRRDPTRRTSKQLMREFLQSLPHDKYTNSYGRGVLEMAMGIINEEERFLGMYDFACWYRDLLEREKAKGGSS